MGKNNMADLTGQRFGNRVVVRKAEPKNGRNGWVVLCDCGTTSQVLTQALTRTKKCRNCCHKGERPNRRKRPYESRYNNFLKRARFKVFISYEDYAEIAKNKKCHYCDAALEWEPFGRASGGCNLDRKDFKLGYKLDNVVPCCARCNYAKGTHFSYAEWLEIAQVIKKWGNAIVQPITPLSSKHTLEQKQKELEHEQETQKV